MERFENQPQEIKRWCLDKAKEKRIMKNKKRLKNIVKKEKKNESIS
jgi:hypothetical protein